MFSIYNIIDPRTADTATAARPVSPTKHGTAGLGLSRMAHFLLATAGLFGGFGPAYAASGREFYVYTVAEI